MDVTFRQIKAFLAVARCASFTQAAQALHLSQPTLTAQIKQLESALKLKLFDRSTHHVRLTHAGETFVPIVQKIVSELELATAAARKAGSEHQETIRFACFPSFASTVLPVAIAAFRRHRPAVSFALRDIGARRVIADIRSEDVECGVSHDTKATDLESTLLFQDDIVLVYPNNHPVGRMRRVTLRDVAEHPLILLDPSDNSSRALIDAAFAGAVIPAVEVAYISSALAMVQAGLGIAILPSLSLNLTARGPLRMRKIDDTHLVRNISVITKRGANLSASVQAFIEVLIAESKRYRTARGESAGK